MTRGGVAGGVAEVESFVAVVGWAMADWAMGAVDLEVGLSPVCLVEGD